jgi:hypothetical protein
LVEIDASSEGDILGKAVSLGLVILWRRSRLSVLYAFSAVFVVLAEAAILVSYISWMC